jgi:hypothetical protein
MRIAPLALALSILLIAAGCDAGRVPFVKPAKFSDIHVDLHVMRGRTTIEEIAAALGRPAEPGFPAGRDFIWDFNKVTGACDYWIALYEYDPEGESLGRRRVQTLRVEAEDGLVKDYRAGTYNCPADGGL